MIQRIQTIFLLTGSILLSILFCTDMAYGPEFSVKYTEIAPLLIMNIVTCGICFVSIFLYKKRILQIRINIFNTVLLFVYQGWILYYFFTFMKDTAFSITAMFPVIAAVLTMLAVKYIRRDEALVQTASRLRK